MVEVLTAAASMLIAVFSILSTTNRCKDAYGDPFVWLWAGTFLTFTSHDDLLNRFPAISRDAGA